MSAAEDRWREYKERVFGTEYMIWHDGLYTGAVTSLRGAERDEALEMLRLGVSLGDAHAAEALAAMGDRTSEASMREQLAVASGASRVRLALAIHEMAPDPALAAHLVDVLQSPAHWGVRIDAAIGLRHFAGAADERALLDAIEDPEYLVRYHACDSLLVRWRATPPELSAHSAIFSLVCGPQEGPPTEADYERFREARAALLRLRPDGVVRG